MSDTYGSGQVAPFPGLTPEKAAEIRDQVQARVDEERERYGGGGGGGDVPGAFVRQCLEANAMGDGMLYAELLGGRFLHAHATGDWYEWAGHRWKRDKQQRALAAVDLVAQRYLAEAEAAQRDAARASKNRAKALNDLAGDLHRRASRLRGVSGRHACLEFAASLPDGDVSVTGDELDADPMLLAFQNGVLDLRTGQLRDGRQTDYITKACAVDYDEHAQAPRWEQFLDEIFLGDADLVAYVQAFMGYACSGLVTMHKVPVLYGAGRNDKGVFVETISHVLGAYARTMDPEKLLDQGRSRSAGAPSPEIMGFHGARVAWMSETDNRRSLCGSMVKRLSGGDTMVGRNPHDKHNTEFTPTHTMFLQTNHKPRADGDDYALWRRLVLWPFEATFNEDPVGPRQFAMDPDLGEKLKAEAQGVAAWLVRGWLAWQRGGLPRCEAIEAATRDYQRAEDLLGMFLEDSCDRDPEGKTASTRLYDLYKVVREDHKRRIRPAAKRLTKP